MDLDNDNYGYKSPAEISGLSFQLQTGKGRRVVFPNGQVAEIDSNDRFTTIIAYPKAKKLAMIAAQGSSYIHDWRYDCLVMATGSGQIVHSQTIHLADIGADIELVLVSGGVFAIPHEIIDDRDLPSPLGDYNNFKVYLDTLP